MVVNDRYQALNFDLLNKNLIYYVESPSENH